MNTPFKTTPERRANLVKLARFLSEEPIEAERFDMDHFSVLKTGDGQVLRCVDPMHQGSACGAVCCAIGWGPSAGIAADGEFSWWSYCDRNFIEAPEDVEPPEEWEWCFGSGWSATDNTAKGAAKRILWLLMNDLPVNAECQRFGKAPLCYADWTPTEDDWEGAARCSP